MKNCSKCGNPSERFRKNRHGNPSSVCLQCANKEHAAYYRKNPVIYLLNACRDRCRKRGLPFDLVKEDIVVPSVCPVLGIPLEHGTKPFHDNSPSLDRIVPSKGYVKGNVEVISFRANRIKTDATFAEIQKVADWLRSKEVLPG